MNFALYRPSQFTRMSSMNVSVSRLQQNVQTRSLNSQLYPLTKLQYMRMWLPKLTVHFASENVN